MSTVAHELIGRFADTAMWRRLAYLALSLPIGIAGFVVAIVLLSVGVGTVVIWVGLPILVLLMVQARRWAGVERRLIATLLGRHIPAPPPPDLHGSYWNKIGQQLSNRTNWKSVVWRSSAFRWVAWPSSLYLAYFGASISCLRCSDHLRRTGRAEALAVVGGVAMLLLVPTPWMPSPRCTW